jgi:hypothetical protein
MGQLDEWSLDGELHDAMERLAAENKSLLGTTDATGAAAEDRPTVQRELVELRLENSQLRARLEELEQQQQASSDERELGWAEMQKDYESLLEEKSEVIRTLHQQIQELREKPAQETDAIEMSGHPLALKQEIQRLREEVEREREQLLEDEAAVEEQLRQMELTMSRERVELARQRNELLRLQGELKHELELAARDDKLRDRLAPLQRRHQEIVNGRGAAPPPSPGTLPGSRRPSTMVQLPTPQEPAPSEPSPKSNSGLLRRLFRRG